MQFHQRIYSAFDNLGTLCYHVEKLIAFHFRKYLACMDTLLICDIRLGCCFDSLVYLLKAIATCLFHCRLFFRVVELHTNILDACVSKYLVQFVIWYAS